MVLTVHKFFLPKRGNAVEEYEDAFTDSLADRRFAVADGATESSFAAEWAQILTRAFVLAPPLDSDQLSADFPEWLKPLQHSWTEGIAWNNLPWFSVEKAKAGAFSTLLGMEFTEDESRVGQEKSGDPKSGKKPWIALAVGDTCVFHLRDDKLLTAFPLKTADQFGNAPLLLSSNPSRNSEVWDDIHVRVGDSEPEDLFVLATDALAHWFLAQCEEGFRPWVRLCALRDDEGFAAFVDEIREENLIRNDDVTLLIIRLDAEVPFDDESHKGGEGKPLTNHNDHSQRETIWRRIRFSLRRNKPRNAAIRHKESDVEQ